MGPFLVSLVHMAPGIASVPSISMDLSCIIKGRVKEVKAGVRSRKPAREPKD